MINSDISRKFLNYSLTTALSFTVSVLCLSAVIFMDTASKSINSTLLALAVLGYLNGLFLLGAAAGALL